MIFRTWILALALMSLPAPGQISVQVGPGNTLRLHGASEMVLGGDLDIRGDFAGEGTLTTISDAIASANSVVRCSISKREIWGGTPARYIHHR